jgi:hypothetical protein
MNRIFSTSEKNSIILYEKYMLFDQSLNDYFKKVFEYSEFKKIFEYVFEYSAHVIFEYIFQICLRKFRISSNISKKGIEYFEYTKKSNSGCWDRWDGHNKKRRAFLNSIAKCDHI